MMTLTQPLISKRCSTCKNDLPVDAFAKHKSTKDGLQYRCRSCVKTHRGAYDFSKQKNLSLKHKFGLSLAEYNVMLEKQNGQCAICGTDKCETGYSLAVDHCHVTGKIRGLLCRTCNTTLGKFNDEIERFYKAARYLEATQPSNT